MTSRRAGLSLIIVGVIICSYAPPGVNINHLQKIGARRGSDFTGVGALRDEPSVAEQECGCALAMACLNEALLSGQQLETAPANSISSQLNTGNDNNK